MDYEKKYKEALERAKEKYTKCYSPALLDYIFPELKSEDVEIRRSIIRNLKRYIKCIKDGYDASSAKDFVVKEIEKQIAWLEKQGDTNETINKDEFAQGVLKGAAINLITWIDYNAAEGNMCLSNMECKDVEDALVSGDWNKIYAYIKKKLEKQYEYNPYSGTSFKYNGHIWGMCARDGGVEILVDGEIKERVFLDNKPQDKYAQEATKEEKVDNQNCVNFADDVKPKFKVGDWVVFDNGNVEHITSVGTHGYTFDDGDYLLHDECDKIAHLWSIQDAKDGDVLVNGSNIFIFHFINGTRLMGYCHVNTDNGRFYDDIGKNECFCLIDAVINPATKEQRDLLFQKMKEAGYIFDFKNKELKKIKNDIEIPFGAKDSELQEATYFIPKGFHAEIDDDKVIIKKDEKPAAWSKKDEKMFEYALNMIEWYSGKNEDKSRYVSDWFKSLKQRIGG